MKSLSAPSNLSNILLVPCLTSILSHSPTHKPSSLKNDRRNLIKEVGSSTSQSLAPVQNSKTLRDQGMENPIESCTDNKMSENDRSHVAILENMEEKNSGDEIEVRAGASNNEAGQGHTGKLNEYDPSLDIPIALRKGTRSCT